MAYSTIPDEEDMDGTDKHQECQSPNEQCDALRMVRQMVVLDREPYSKEKREQRQGLEINADHQKRVQRTVEPAAIDPIVQKIARRSRRETRWSR